MFLKCEEFKKHSVTVTTQFNQKGSNNFGKKGNNSNSKKGRSSQFGNNYQGNKNHHGHMFPNQGNRFLGPQGRPPFNPPQNCVVCQSCDKARHTARVCRSRPPSYFTPKENFMAREPQIHNANWVIDSGASQHITSDLQNLSIHSEYGGTDDVIIGDGNGISITHTDSTNLITENSNFMLGNVLCAPSIHKNLIFVS